MAELELHFRHKKSLVLQHTVFRYGKNQVAEVRREKTPKILSLTRGRSAHFIILLKWAAEGRKEGVGNGSELSQLPVDPQTPEQSVDEEWKSELVWRVAIFGTVEFKNLVIRKELTEGHFFDLNTKLLPPKNITVTLNDVPLNTEAEIQQLCERLSKQWASKSKSKDNTGRKDSEPKAPFPTLTPILAKATEREPLIELAARAMELPPSQLRCALGVMLGLAQRVHLVAELREAVHVLKHDMRLIDGESHKNPATATKFQEWSKEALNRFSDVTKSFLGAGLDWPQFEAFLDNINQLIVPAGAELVSLLEKATHAPASAPAAPEPASPSVVPVDNETVKLQIKATSEASMSTAVLNRVRSLVKTIRNACENARSPLNELSDTAKQLLEKVVAELRDHLTSTGINDAFKKSA